MKKKCLLVCLLSCLLLGQSVLRRVQRREIRCVSGTLQPFRRDAVGEGECLGDDGGVRRALRGVFR